MASLIVQVESELGAHPSKQAVVSRSSRER